jgi:FAD/FMN-containing dehydrogenase
MIKAKYRASPAEKKKVLAALRRAVGPERATDNPAVLYSYSGTSMLFPKVMPDFLVRPGDVEEVRRILAVARKHRVPVTPVASGTQEPGTYAWFGGMVLDTMAMNRVREINADGAYATIEPGVTMGRLSAELARHNLRCTMGSFPPGISALGNYLMTAVNSHRSAGPLDDLLGIEAVLADGAVVRTGSRAFGHTYPGTGWHSPTNGFPNPKNLFIDAAGTLGVVTAGAVRAYSLGEARTMQAAAFPNYASALAFMIRIARGNLVQHVCAWHWCLYTIIDHLGRYGRGAPADILIYDPWQPPDERPYILVVPTIAGFAEHVAAAEQTFARVAREMGGSLYTDECREKWPGAWKFFCDHYRDHVPSNQFMGGFGEGFPVMPIVIGDPKKMPALEQWGLRFLRRSPLRLGLSYYSHVIDHGRSIFLRMTPFISGESSEKEKQQAAATRQHYMEQAFKRYGAVPIRFDMGYPPGELLARTGGLKDALRAVKYGLDPENIVNPGMSVAMYGPPPRPRRPKKER